MKVTLTDPSRRAVPTRTSLPLTIAYTMSRARMARAVIVNVIGADAFGEVPLSVFQVIENAATYALCEPAKAFVTIELVLLTGKTSTVVPAGSASLGILRSALPSVLDSATVVAVPATTTALAPVPELAGAVVEVDVDVDVVVDELVVGTEVVGGGEGGGGGAA